jgi:hypothetical protein
MPIKLPSIKEAGREAWDRAHAAHHLNEIERQLGLLEFHAARVGPTEEGCDLIDEICIRLQAVKGLRGMKEAA